ncbi:hypothetical protein B5P43_21450 [Bacillus sp. SRB_336]|nr:hypothetical protein B5P43_21450 [Bacillus sp. SRB_336]
MSTHRRVSLSSPIRKDEVRWQERFLIVRKKGAALAGQTTAHGIQRDRVERIDSVGHEIETYLAGTTIEGPGEITGLPAAEHRLAEAVHCCERKTSIRRLPAGLRAQDVARCVAQRPTKQDQRPFCTQ